MDCAKSSGTQYGYNAKVSCSSSPSSEHGLNVFTPAPQAAQRRRAFHTWAVKVSLINIGVAIQGWQGHSLN